MQHTGNHENKIFQYIQELDGCAAALKADLKMADKIFDELKGEFHSASMAQFIAKKDSLMPECMELGVLMEILAQELRRFHELCESIDMDIASNFL